MKIGHKLTILLTIAVVSAVVALSGRQVLASPGTTLYVDDDNCPGPGSGTLLDPYCKTQDAVDNSANGDTIVVRPGTYLEEVTVDKDVTLKGQAFPIVQGTSSAFVVSADGATIEGFNARADDTVLWVQANNVTIAFNRITGLGASGQLDHAGIFVIGPDFDRHLIPEHAAAWPTTELSGITIKKNQITGTTEPGITFNRVAGSVVIQNIIQDVTGDGVQLLSTSNQPSHHNTVKQNIIRNAGIGVKVVNSNFNNIAQNAVQRSRFDGIQARDFVFLGTTHHNTFNRNVSQNSGVFDAHDLTAGGGTAGTANTWTRNACRTDSPDGLCP